MTPILQYRDFWDVPRMFFVEHRGELFLFDCPFDEHQEDFVGDYSVYAMPPITEVELAGSWEAFPARARRFIGKVPVSQVKFDATRRKGIATERLDDLLDRTPAAVAQ